MRLTLRTLLSWKDGMLDPDAARDLAGKVESSAAARQLVARIDEVAARPTLSASAPDADGFAAAANSTAEYLDNVMPAGRIGEFEQVCYASDAQLAETAATHEMLAEWSRAPAAPIDAAARRRLLAAVQARLAGGQTAKAAVVKRRVPTVPVPTRPPAGAAPRAAPTSAWLLVAAAVTLLALLVGVLWWSLAKPTRRGGQERQVAAAEAAPTESPVTEPSAEDVAEPVEPPPAAPPADQVVPPHPAVPPAVEQPRVEPPPKAVDRQADDVPPVADEEPMEPAADPAEPVRAEVVVPAPVAAVDQLVPQGAALAIAARPAPAAAAGGAPPPAPVEQPAAPEGDEADVRAVGGDVLLARPVGANADAWVVARGAPIETPADLVAPPFARPELAIGEARVMFNPGTRAVLTRDAGGAPLLEVVFGAATVAGPCRLGVVAGGLAGAVSVAAAAPVGVEVTLVRQPGAPPEATQRSARIMAGVGELTWRAAAADGGAGAEVRVPVGRALVWRGDAPTESRVEPMPAAPDWLTGGVRNDEIDRLAAAVLPRRLAAGTAALPALRELAASSRAEQRMAAAAALAILGEFDALAVLMLADEPNPLWDRQWERLDAVAVQPALARGPKAVEAFNRAIAAHAPPGASDTIVRFARGLGDEELAAGGGAELIAALESPHLAVRRYALKNLVAITGNAADGAQYRADWQDAALRKKGAAWWRARLERAAAVRAGDAGDR